MNYVGIDFVKQNPEAIFLDCRFKMSEPEEGRKAYERSHIKGAYYIDLDRDMMGVLSEHGGRHPLPDMDKFREKIESCGITDTSVVIIYDDGLFPTSSRLLIMLKYLGKKAYILNGGFDELVSAGFECDSNIPKLNPVKLNTKINSDVLVDIDYVLKNKDKENVILVDSRANERYLGITEPIDRIAGRIPSAVNIFWKDCFDGTKLKSIDELKRIFAKINEYDEAIFYCGSGVTGAINTVIFDSLGGNAKLYSGSFSDYISYKGLELIVKDNKSIIL